MKPCARCGAQLAPDAPPHHVYCRACWVANTYGAQAPRGRARAPAGLPVTTRQAVVALGLDRTMYRRLVSLAHPDRNGQSDIATAVATWLNTTIRPALIDALPLTKSPLKAGRSRGNGQT